MNFFSPPFVAEGAGGADGDGAVPNRAGVDPVLYGSNLGIAEFGAERHGRLVLTGDAAIQRAFRGVAGNDCGAVLLPALQCCGPSAQVEQRHLLRLTVTGEAASCQDRRDIARERRWSRGRRPVLRRQQKQSAQAYGRYQKTPASRHVRTPSTLNLISRMPSLSSLRAG